MEHFYSPLVCEGWRIGYDWVSSYSLFSKIAFGLLFALSGAAIEHTVWPQDTAMSRRLVRLVISAIVGPLIVIALMFAISLFVYAPSAVLANVEHRSASSASAAAEQRHHDQEMALTTEVSQLRKQGQCNSLVRELAQIKLERDLAFKRAADEKNFAARVLKATDEYGKSEQEFEQAIDREQDEWKALVSLSTGLMSIKDGVSEDSVIAEKKLFELRHSESGAARSKVHDKAQSLRFIEVSQ
jgi:hypothetical protein